MILFSQRIFMISYLHLFTSVNGKTQGGILFYLKKRDITSVRLTHSTVWTVCVWNNGQIHKIVTSGDIAQTVSKRG